MAEALEGPSRWLLSSSVRGCFCTRRSRPYVVRVARVGRWQRERMVVQIQSLALVLALSLALALALALV